MGEGMSAGHEKIVSHDDREPPSIKNFGLTFAIVLGVIALWPLVFRSENPRYWALVLALAFAAAAYLAPSLLKPLNLLWFRLGMLLHRIVNPIVLAGLQQGLIWPNTWFKLAIPFPIAHCSASNNPYFARHFI